RVLFRSAGGRQSTTVRTEDHSIHRRLVTHQRQKLVSGRSAPNLGGSIHAAGREVASVLAKRHGVDLIVVAGDRKGLRARLRRPQGHGGVAHADDACTIGTKRESSWALRLIG